MAKQHEEGGPGAIEAALREAREACALGGEGLARGEYAPAEAAFRLALERSGAAGADALAVDALRGLVKCAFFSGRPEAALTHGIQALHLAERLGDEGLETAAHNDLGLVYGRLGDYEGALGHLLAGLRLRRGRGMGEDGSVLNNVGNVYLELKDDRQALGFFTAALEAFEARGTPRQRAIALGNVGRTRARLGEHEAARDAFLRSVRELEESGDRAYLAPALARLGGASEALGDDETALGYLELALATAGESGQGEFLDEVLVEAGRFHLERGRVGTAIDLLRRALATIPPGETSPRMAETHGLLADAYERDGDLAGALRHLKARQSVGEAVADAAATVRIRKLMVEFDVERARQQEEIFRLKNVELASANEELRALHEQLEARNRELERLSLEDALTGVFNRRYMELQLPHEISRARRRGRTLSVAMCDIDHFKEVNDRFSHAVGDEVLRRLGRLLDEATRDDDLAVRYGGEEFLIVMPETDMAGAAGLAERLRASIAAHPWEEVQPGLRVTMSVGLAEIAPGVDAARLLEEADARLYWAKRHGRDRVGGNEEGAGPS